MKALVRVVLALLVAAMATLTVLVFVPGVPVAVYDTLYFIPLVAAPFLCLARAAASSRDRIAWILVGVGSLLWLLGDVYWTVILRDVDPQPFPSIADGLFLAFYPPVYLALILMLRTRLPRLRAHIWLDGLMGALAVGAVATALVFSAVAATSEGNGWAIATNLAYPLADTILLALVVGAMALTGGTPTGRSHSWPQASCSSGSRTLSTCTRSRPTPTSSGRSSTSAGRPRPC